MYTLAPFASRVTNGIHPSITALSGRTSLTQLGEFIQNAFSLITQGQVTQLKNLLEGHGVSSPSTEAIPQIAFGWSLFKGEPLDPLLQAQTVLMGHLIGSPEEKANLDVYGFLKRVQKARAKGNKEKS